MIDLRPPVAGLRPRCWTSLGGMRYFSATKGEGSGLFGFGNGQLCFLLRSDTKEFLNTFLDFPPHSFIQSSQKRAGDIMPRPNPKQAYLMRVQQLIKDVYTNLGGRREE